MRRKIRRAEKRIKKGFTLIELIVVIGILAILLGITLTAVNPLEGFNKAGDVALQAVAKDFVSATNYYYTYQKTLPWVVDSNCKNELSSKKILADMPSCAHDLIQGGQLETKFLSSDQQKNTYITECNGGIAVCYNPKSQTYNRQSDVKYTQNGAINPNCPSTSGTSADCYSCIFSTNEAQQCFQALNPNGSLALVPSPSPDQLLPIPNRYSKNTCNNSESGSVACLAKVVTDSTGTALSSLAPPAGFGPTQLHTAYNLPCTPGGSVQSTCNSPETYGPQTIAVVIAYHSPNLENDLGTYNQTYGLPSCTTANGCLTILNQNGTAFPLPSSDANWALEESMDVEIAHAVCQTCKILVVEAQTNNWTDINTAENKAASLNPTAISNSFGASEWSGETSFDSYFNHPGIYITASSGDYGYGGLYPAASKNVISVGGTTLSLLSNNSYNSESIWSGAGSGCSPFEVANSFQTSVSNWNLTGCGTKRGSTDASADADPNTGVAIYDSTSYAGRSGWWILGGTSLSSPIVSAALTMMGSAPQGLPAASVIYSNTSKFRDVKSGSNGSCGGTAMCSGANGYDGPSGIGSPNLIGAAVPTSSPTSAPPTTSTPTQASLNCTNIQTVLLAQSDPIIALPGDTVNNTLTITSNDDPGCSSQYTISQGFPTGWTFTGIPPSFTLSGGATQTIPFTIHIPDSATAGNYGYQFWVAKQGQQTVNPVDGSIQVVQPGPTNTPTPTPISCTQSWTNSLGSTSLSGNAGDTVQQTLFIKNNNDPSCGSAVFTISYAEPSGFTTLNLPPSVTLSGGQSTTISFSITISTGAQIQDYLTQYWIDSGSLPLNATIHVVGLAQPPQQQMFGNFSVRPYGNYALFMFSYNANGTGSFRLDVATDPSALNQTSGPNSAGYYGFAFSSGNAMDPSNTATPTSTRGFINSSPQSWSGWQCGATVYYRMYNSGDLRIMSPIQSTVVDCSTVIDVLPWSPWYTAIYQGVYDARYDADTNGVINWTDYWILVKQTRLR